MSAGHNYKDKETIENFILTTLSFYDTMGIPMAPLEIYRNLIIPPCQRGGLRGGGSFNFCDFLKVLESSEVIKEKTEKFNGMYYLKCRDAAPPLNPPLREGGRLSKEIYNHRQLNYRMAIKKWIILRRCARIFEAVPFCQAVFVSGSLTRNNTSQSSDIDLLIIGEHGRLWTVRAFMMLAAKIIGRHRSGGKVADMFCLNHFISDKDLEIKHKSIYTAEMYSKLVSIFSRNDCGEENILESFREKNEWIKEFIPMSYGVAPRSLKKFSSSFILRAKRSFFEFILSGFLGDFAERIARKIQEPRIKKNSGKPDGRVVFSDSEIELHPNSPEKRIVEGLNLRLENLGVQARFKDSGLTI